jgi:hypothetical protein
LFPSSTAAYATIISLSAYQISDQAVNSQSAAVDPAICGTREII